MYSKITYVHFMYLVLNYISEKYLVLGTQVHFQHVLSTKEQKMY